MYFYVFLQPEVFEEAASDGEDATQTVAAIVSGFCQNCFLVVFEDDRWDWTVKEKMEHWPENMTRRRVTSMLVHLKKQKRILYCVTPDYLGLKPELDLVFEQAILASMDLIMVIASEGNRSAPAGVEIATRRSYYETVFELKRSELAVYGKTCNSDEMDETSFMDFHFGKALKHASTINICDRVCGRSGFADNFRYTISRFLAWLGTVLSNPSSCRIIFHLGQPEGLGLKNIMHELGSLKKGALGRTSFEVRFYGEPHSQPALPHQRFIATDQIALDVDRGLDFLDRRTRRCRDSYVNYQDPKIAHGLLSTCSSGCMSTHVL